MTAPVLVIGYGNPSRGDDALGPEFVDRLAQRFARQIDDGELEVLTDFQPQVEHALDLRGRQRVFFVDASVSGAAFEVHPVLAQRDSTYTTHLLSPGAVLFTYSEVERREPPAAWIIAIRGEKFELGEPLSEPAQADFQRRWSGALTLPSP